MKIIKEPKPDPSLTKFNDGLAILNNQGEVAGHIATSVGKFWSPFSPFSRQWWVWSVIVWKDGTKERALEDYPPWSYVKEMQGGKLSWNDKTFSIEWLPPEKAKLKKKELDIKPEDF